MSKLKDDILLLLKNNKTYREIQSALGCAKSTISYYSDYNKNKQKNNEKNLLRRNSHPYFKKVDRFLYHKRSIKKQINHPNNKIRKLLTDKILNFHQNRKTKEYNMSTFTVEDVINKFGENPRCYLTGINIDINQPRTYQFDHIIPVSRGGDNSLDNLGICTKQANLAKSNMMYDEFIDFCKKVLINHGYNINTI